MYQPSWLKQVTGKAAFDGRVYVAAFAASADLCKELFWDLHFSGRDRVIDNVVCYLRHEVNLFETFSECILGNMLSKQSVESTGSHLTLLNQGMETSFQYKTRLADYLGVPKGKWLQQLRQAERNVSDAIAPFWGSDDLMIQEAGPASREVLWNELLQQLWRSVEEVD